MKHRTSLFLLLLLAAGVQAQVLNPQAGKAYAISSTSDATAVTPVSYQWYRNGQPIAGATGKSYTVPAEEAYGANVEFVRKATAQDCSGANEANSNTVTVTFGEGWPTLTVGTVTWAATNVAAQGTLANNPDDYGMFYQWNRNVGWAAIGDVIGWNATYDAAATWTVNPHPCPAGWVLPSSADFVALIGTDGTWAAANDRGNAVAGTFFGPNHASCSLPSNMAGCVFFPAAGYRELDSSGTLSSQGTIGCYQQATQHNSTNGYYTHLTSSISTTYSINKAYGLSVRCVQK